MLTFRVMLSLPDRLRTVSVAGQRHVPVFGDVRVGHRDRLRRTEVVVSRAELDVVGARRQIRDHVIAAAVRLRESDGARIVVPVDSLVSRLDEWEQG